jgi:hypothetical protein
MIDGFRVKCHPNAPFTSDRGGSTRR